MTRPSTSDHILEESTIHDVLSNKRRRVLLSLLTDEGVAHTLRELSEQIAEHESGVSPAPRDLRQSVYVSLQQTHVPKLTRLGIIEYEQDGKIVTLSDHADDVTVYLEVVPGYHLAWSEYYLGVSLLGLLTVVASLIGVPMVSRVAGPTWAIFFLGLVVVSATYHTYALGSTVFDRTRSQ